MALNVAMAEQVSCCVAFEMQKAIRITGWLQIGCAGTGATGA
jgi:hypothetical protein